MRLLRLAARAGALVLLLLAGTTIPSPSRAAVAADGQLERPNIVLVLVDDMDLGMVRFMPQLRRMQQQGATFVNSTVVDSLCCSSRASLLAGKFPHNTGVLTNLEPYGGFGVFHRRGGERDTIATQLQAAGYRTGMMGKYLNGYEPGRKLGGAKPYVPPGWTRWVVTGGGYNGYNYDLNVNGALVKHGSKPQDYLTDVLTGYGRTFIENSAAARSPFFLEIAPFVPHRPATPAPRHATTFPGLTAPRAPSFNEADKSDKPQWLRDVDPLNSKQVSQFNAEYRKRAQSLQAVDDMLRGIQQTLNRTGQARNTYIMFTSDNGFHMGEHGLQPGKQTAFETDIVVPLIATGPGVPAGRTVQQPVENIDLRPTFAELASAVPNPAVDGQSFAAVLHGRPAPRGSKTMALVEHHNTYGFTDPPLEVDPDLQPLSPPHYNAIRTPDATYVEYVTGEREYYDHTTDAYQLNNSYAALPRARKQALHDSVGALIRCKGTDQCRKAASTAPRARPAG